MLSDETFPSDLISDISDGEDFSSAKKVKIISTKVKSAQSMDEINQSMSTTDEESNNSSIEEEQSMMENSLETERLITSKFDESENNNNNNMVPEASFQSASSLKIDNILPPPRAPIKKKKSFSCHNLNNMKRTNTISYDHVESKVKKLIENLNEDRRKSLLRHKSMPVCGAQITVNDEYSNNNNHNNQVENKERDYNEIKRELRRKSIKIYELEEKIELQGSQIYDLNKEKSKMKMVFDKLRVEMKELKEIERQYNHLKAQCSPNKTQKSVLIQTDDSGTDSMEYSKVNILRESVVIHHNPDTNCVHAINPVIRQLAFECSNLNQSDLCDTINTSSDNLIPSENSGEQIDLIAKSAVQHDHDYVQNQPKKKKKKIKFFSFVPCVFRK